MCVACGMMNVRGAVVARWDVVSVSWICLQLCRQALQSSFASSSQSVSQSLSPSVSQSLSSLSVKCLAQSLPLCGMTTGHQFLPATRNMLQNVEPTKWTRWMRTRTVVATVACAPLPVPAPCPCPVSLPQLTAGRLRDRFRLKPRRETVFNLSVCQSESLA